MQTKPQPFAVLVLIAALVFSTLTVVAQGQTTDQTNNWSRVTALAAGAKIAVKLKTGKTLNGTVNSVSDSALSLNVKNSTREIKREEIATVHEVVKKGSATKSTLIGTGIGAGVGAAAGGIASANDDSGFEKIDHVATAALAIVGAGSGALVGYLVGRGGNKRVLLYEAK
jgi:small nuclear ribonucleoprotein (snRNP)-like protein